MPRGVTAETSAQACRVWRLPIALPCRVTSTGPGLTQRTLAPAATVSAPSAPAASPPTRSKRFGPQIGPQLPDRSPNLGFAPCFAAFPRAGSNPVSPTLFSGILLAVGRWGGGALGRANDCSIFLSPIFLSVPMLPLCDSGWGGNVWGLAEKSVAEKWEWRRDGATGKWVTTNGQSGLMNRLRANRSNRRCTVEPAARRPWRRHRRVSAPVDRRRQNGCRRRCERAPLHRPLRGR
ncbi:hypothetical protein Enr13x_24290 [Stieleria neptunia]|uniref:Uncharacterized protein n=1 Tax=Stieleria neptunia TaxID=2527979 RepID=A0A518HP27_9BACT|nr:hypothetical protein Enr13x_24290 [Stieleria neptunia]